MNQPSNLPKSSFRLKWRLCLAILVLIASNSLIFAAVSGELQLSFLSSQRAYAQGGGQEPDAKISPMDFYPEPFGDGALAFSLRDPWPKTDLTYYFHNCPSRLECGAARNAVRLGFQAWQNVSALIFQEVFDVSQADIEVTWTVNDPEGALGQPGDVLAYNYFPRYGGDMFIDDSEPWTIGDNGPFDLIIAATHEIGHGIGLGHSEFTTAIMYAYSGNATTLGQDDIKAIQSLYGPPQGSSPATTTVNSATDINNANGTIPSTVDTIDEVQGAITNTHAYDIWELDVDAGMTVTITMTKTSGNLDPYIGILNQDRSAVLAENDNHIGTDAQVVYTFDEAGTYAVTATRFGFERGTTIGTYTLTARFSRGNGSTPETNVPAPQTISWRVTNFAETNLCKIYFGPSSDTTWGEDRSDGDLLEHNFYFQWEITPDSYDLQVWDCFGNKLEKYNIDASRSVDVQVFKDRISVVALEDEEVQPTSNTFAFRVSNYTNVQICKIFFSQADENNWGANRIAAEPPLEANFYYEWQVDSGAYDIRVEDCNSGFLEFYGIELSRHTEVAVFSNQITPRSLQ